MVTQAVPASEETAHAGNDVPGVVLHVIRTVLGLHPITSQDIQQAELDLEVPGSVFVNPKQRHCDDEERRHP
jgi:hypothetical protein